MHTDVSTQSTTKPMMETPLYALPYAIAGLSSITGRVVPMDEWAADMQVPDRKTGGVLSGARVQEILGVHSKSWDPELFADPNTVQGVAQRALRSAGIAPEEVDAFLLVTCTPYEIKLGQDGFRFARGLGLRDDVVVMQLEAGCGGLARAMRMVATLNAQKVLVLAYNAASPQVWRRGVNPLYMNNATHPQSSLLWASAGIFSDGAAAMVLRRDESVRGFCFYSRDSLSFGDGPGFDDTIVQHPGGGVLHPPGLDSEELMCFAMSGRVIAEYYNKGMLLNHVRLLQARPELMQQIRRLYTHQAGPAMVRRFVDIVNLPPEMAPTHAERLGNLVSPCTLTLMHDDLVEGKVQAGDMVCVSVVGAGPERGAFVLRLQASAEA